MVLGSPNKVNILCLMHDTRRYIYMEIRVLTIFSFPSNITERCNILLFFQ